MNDSNFCLNPVQFKAIKECADCEQRSMEQMLSLLLDMGVHAFYQDYSSPTYNDPDVYKLEEELKLDAIRAIKK